jgi:hypothetical protein
LLLSTEMSLGPRQAGALDHGNGESAEPLAFAWRRHLHLMLDAYRAERSTPLPEPPLTRAEMELGSARLNRVP